MIERLGGGRGICSRLFFGKTFLMDKVLKEVYNGLDG